MLLLIRLAAFCAFYGLAVGLPGFLLGRAVAGGKGSRASLLLGMLGVFAMAVVIGFLLHARVSRPILAVAGALVALGSTAVLRRREKLGGRETP